MSSLAAGVALGGVVGLALMIFLVMRARREALPPLTAEALQAAHERWQQRGPEDYQMDVVVTGSQTSTYHVTVRGGAPSAVTQGDELPVKRRATWQYWTVAGLLDVLDHDLRFIDDPARGFGASPGSAVILRARFDADLGFPVEYERVILSPSSQMRWTVKGFRALEHKEARRPR
ncbi:MAG TPA: DUF6174 domain-containing protein [Pirellulales bacterium]|nr:DUF6174 domain-containing protein [Pirellulales bacterium]